MKLKLAAAMVVAILMSAFAGAEVDRSTPENTVKSFIQALIDSDYDGMVSCVKGANREKELEEMFKKHGDETPTAEVSVSNVKIEGDKASCSVVVKISGKNRPEESMNDSLHLEKVGDAWQIVPLKGEPDPKHIVNMLATAVSEPKGLFLNAKRAAQKAVCLSNIKQLATAFMMVAADNDDYFKVKANAWKKAIMPYVKNEAIFTCPLDPKGTVSYSINPAIAGITQTSINDIARTVLLYEGSKGKLNFRHGGYAAVAFADGHAKMVNAEEAKKLIWKP